MLFNAILYDTIAYYTIPYHTILYYTVLYNTILYRAIQYYTITYYTILYYTILYYTILYYTMLYYAKLYYSTLHYTTLYYRLVDTRSIWIMPTANAIGYFQNRREENGVDPNGAQRRARDGKVAEARPPCAARWVRQHCDELPRAYDAKYSIV